MALSSRSAGSSRWALARLVLGAAFLAAGVLLILGSQFAARASAPGAPSIQAAQTVPPTDDYCDDDDDDPVSCFGPAGQAAGLLAADGTTAPDARDADLGGVAATGVLLMSVGGAVVAGGAGGLAGLGGAASGAAGSAGGAGSSAGGAGGAGGAGSGAASGASSTSGGVHELAAKAAASQAAATGQAATTGHAIAGQGAAGHLATAVGGGATAGVGNAVGSIAANAAAVGNLTTAAGSGLPLPRPELIVAGLSIFRSMKRVTDEADPTGYSAGDIAQLMGDAAGIGALASILAPAAGLVSLATAGAAAGADVYSPAEVLERLRRNFGQLGYMQGVLDENVSQVDGQLAGLDGAPQGTAAGQAPEIPADPTALSDADLRAARTAWAARADAETDSLIRMQEEVNDLDDRRRNLAHQVDAVSDFLARLDDAGSTPLPAHLGDTIRYGIGWYQAGDPERMSTALRESRAQAREAAKPQTAATAAGSSTEAAGPSTATAAARVSPKTRGTPFDEWAAANQVEGGRTALLRAIAGLERWCGFYDALTGTLQRQLVQMRAQADSAGATRRALSAETQRRVLAAGEK